MREFTRHEAAEVSGLHYQTLTSYIHRHLVAEPLGWSHLVALSVAHRLRESGATIPIVRKAIAHISGRSESEIRRLLSGGGRLLVASIDAASIISPGDSFEPKSAALVVDLAAAVHQVDEAILSLPSPEAVPA